MIEMDPRPARGGWAPGNYFSCCTAGDGGFKVCKKEFRGAKRAFMCADCAYALPEVTPQARIDARAALKNIITTWESLPGGRHYTPREIAAWLCGPMKEAIDQARTVIESML